METAIANASKTHWTLRLPRARTLTLSGRPRVMGILNLTPDSFSDGGLWLDPRRAAERGLEMLEQGADLLDLGAESTRPGGGVYGAGADFVPAEEEWRRIAPVLATLRAATDAPLSVDTRKGEVARRALAAGADLINDVGGLDDPELARAVAEAGCPVVLMHSRGSIPTMQMGIRFDDVVSEVRSELGEMVVRAARAGIDPSQVILDPGIGFGKTWDQNLALIARLEHLAGLGRPLLLGASRKSFLASAALESAPPEGKTGAGPAPAERLGGSLAAAAWGRRKGAAVLRVHDVPETVQLLAVDAALAAREAAA